VKGPALWIHPGGGGRNAKTVYGYCSIGGLRVKHDGLVRVFYGKERFIKVQSTLLYAIKENGSVNIGSAVNTGGMLIEIPCIG